jgi:hypothetical protein
MQGAQGLRGVPSSAGAAMQATELLTVGADLQEIIGHLKI